jgi:hypothetical protein
MWDKSKEMQALPARQVPLAQRAPQEPQEQQVRQALLGLKEPPAQQAQQD